MLLGHECSALYAVILEIWPKYEAHCAANVPNLVVYAHLMDRYRNRSAAERLLNACMAEAEYATLLHCAFMAMQHGPASRLKHEYMLIVYGGRGALLQLPGVLVGQWFSSGIFSILKDKDVGRLLALLATT